MKVKITNWFLLLNLSFFMASVSNLQAYRGEQFINESLAKCNELFVFVKDSRNVQIGLGVATIIVASVVVHKLIFSKKPKRKEQNENSESENDDIDEEAMADFYETNKRK